MINIIGCGPGAADHLTDAAKSLISTSDVLIGVSRLLKLAPAGNAETIPVSACVDDTLKALADCRTGERVVSVLVTGDPGIFSLARKVIETFGRENCRLVPGISSVQTAFARIGLNWDDARIISAHHELPAASSIDPVTATKIAVLSGHSAAQEWMADLAESLGAGFTVIACENLTLENEKVTELAPGDIRSGRFESRCVFLIVRKDLLT